MIIIYDTGYLVGRFRMLFDASDKMGIPRPTVHITEFGWTLWEVPSVDKAMAHLQQVAPMYAAYPEVKGASIWYLGGGGKDIAKKAQPLIEPVTQYSLGLPW